MKKNTHIYLAWKAIQLTRESISNTVDEGGELLKGREKTRERLAAKGLQHRLQYHEHAITEAAWAPDEVLKDMNPFHMFKLFTDEEFPGHAFTDCPAIERDGVTYYRFSGGLPYRVDHIAQDIIGMAKLRDFNDQFSLRQIMYHYLLLSHYVVDAHVPMHCDLRDDPPPVNDGTKKPQGRYMRKDAHADLETLWEKAVNPVAIDEDIFPQTLAEEVGGDGRYRDQVQLDLSQCSRGGEIEFPTIAKGRLMEFMIDVCVASKRRCRQLFPLDAPEQRNDDILAGITRETFTSCVADLVAVWRYIDTYAQSD